MTEFRFHPEAEIDLNEIWDSSLRTASTLRIAYATTSSQRLRVSLGLPTKVTDAAT
jgi:hypothetical protein